MYKIKLLNNQICILTLSGLDQSENKIRNLMEETKGFLFRHDGNIS